MMKKLSAVALLFLAILAGTTLVSSPNFSVKAAEQRGIISIAFDDNYQNQYDYAFPLMEEYGIVGTFYVCTQNIGVSGYMSSVQLQTIASSGNEIGSHSHTHTSFTLLTLNEINYECTHSKEILDGYGLTVNNFAYPNGVTNDNIDSIVSEHYRSGRTAYVGPYVMAAPTNQFRVSGFSAETADSTALTLLKGMVDQVYQANGWAIIFFHNIIPNVYTQPYTTSAEDFESFLSYLVSKGVRTSTVNQALELASLSMNTNFGTISPTSGLYSWGATYNIEAFAPTAVDGERFIWIGWNGSGVGSYSGPNNPSSITLQGPISQTAVWKREFRLIVSAENGETSPSAGEYWYQAGSVVNIEAFPEEAGSGERFVWNGWKGTGSGSYSGVDTYASIVMNGPITQVPDSIHQYYVTVSSAFGVAEGTGWYDSGATARATMAQSIVNASSDVKRIFAGWGGDATGTGLISDEMVVDRPLRAIALWKTRCLVVFDQEGLPDDFNASVVLNSTIHSLPFSVWIGEEDTLQFIFQDQFPEGFARSYVLKFPLNQSLSSVTSPVKMVAQYDSQYSMGLFVAIILPLILVFLVASILLLRKRKLI